MKRSGSDRQTRTASALPPLPTQLLDLELSEPIPAIAAARGADGQPYRRAQLLVRLHGQPLGPAECCLADGLPAAACAAAVWTALGPEINTHLSNDGLPSIQALNPNGVPSAGNTACRQDRDRRGAAAPLVSVVIATRDRPDRLALCLASLEKQRYPRYEVIVVDNAPATDATARLLELRSAVRPAIRYAQTPWANTAMARNRGVQLAQGEIVCCIDDDAVADPGWLSALVDAFGAAPNVACVTGLILPLELETPAQFWFEQFGGFGKGFTRRIYDLRANRPRDPLFPYAAGKFGSGPNMAFRRDVLQAIGGFDPALGGGTPAQGGEDLALYFEVIVRGYQLVYEPAALVRHAHRREYAALRRQVRGYGLGLAAFVTSRLVAHPHLVLGFCRRLPAGLRYAYDPRSAKNAKKSIAYPTELTRVELRGMLIGPAAYLLGLRQHAAVEHRQLLGRVPTPASALPAGAG